MCKDKVTKYKQIHLYHSVQITNYYYALQFLKVLEKCTKNLIGHSRLVINNHESNIDC